MKYLELKIPPVIIFILTAALMWSMTLVSTGLGLNLKIRLFVGCVSLFFGGFIAVSGVIGFRRAKTTVDPIKPNKASSLVCTGIYRYTRNPMYTGLFFVLIAWACLWDNFFSLLMVIIFPLYMTQFQIKPEERVLESIFGNDYMHYKKRVRRWL